MACVACVALPPHDQSHAFTGSSIFSSRMAACCLTRTSRGTSSLLVQPPSGDSHSTGFLYLEISAQAQRGRGVMVDAHKRLERKLRNAGAKDERTRTCA